MAALRKFFPNAEADTMNLAMFSTSGVHGTYTTIEEIEEGLTKYPDGPPETGDEWPDDYHGTSLTVVVVQPRICCLRYGTVEIRTLEDVAFIKTLRESSLKAFAKIGTKED